MIISIPQTFLHFHFDPRNIRKLENMKLVFGKKSILVRNMFQQLWPLKSYIHSRSSHKVLFLLGPNLWPQFRLREICREQGLPACGCACNTQSPDVKLHLSLFHLSIGTCPPHLQISLAWSHYAGVYPFFREKNKKDSRCRVFFVFWEEILQNIPRSTLQSHITHSH